MQEGGYNFADNERVREETNVNENFKQRRKSRQDDDGKYIDERNFAGYTTLHGLGRAATVRPWYGKAIWIIAFIGALTALVLQLVDLVSTYTSYKTTTSIEIVRPPDGLEFPAVTVCGLNRLNRTAVEEDLKIPPGDRQLLDYLLTSFQIYTEDDVDAELTAEITQAVHQTYTNYSGRPWNFSEILDIAVKKNEKSFIKSCCNERQ